LVIDLSTQLDKLQGVQTHNLKLEKELNSMQTLLLLKDETIKNQQARIVELERTSIAMKQV
jgi:hypothetical protein